MSRAAAKFRRHVIAQPAGSRIDWHGMDAWAKANCPKSAWRDHDPNDFWADDPWGNLCVECMVICQELEKAGWLHRCSGPNHDWPDDYLRTAKDILD